MPTHVIMPQLGESVVEGTVGKWLIAEGQPVKEYEPLLTVTTDKVDTEIPAPASGILLAIYVAEGTTVAAGTVLAEIGEQGAGGRRQESGIRGQEAGDRGQGAGGNPQSAIRNPQSAISATPVAQRMAAELGIALADVPGTGPGGRVTKEDVEAYLAFFDGETAPNLPIYQVPIYQLPPSASSRRPWDTWPRSGGRPGAGDRHRRGWPHHQEGCAGLRGRAGAAWASAVPPSAPETADLPPGSAPAPETCSNRPTKIDNQEGAQYISECRNFQVGQGNRGNQGAQGENNSAPRPQESC